MSQKRKLFSSILLGLLLISFTGCTPTQKDPELYPIVAQESQDFEIKYEPKSYFLTMETSIEEIQETTIEETTQEVIYTYTSLDQPMWATTSVNVRNGPEVSFSVQSSLSPGMEVQVTGQCNETGWYQVLHNEIVGYVNSNYLSAEMPDPVPNICQVDGWVSSDWAYRVNQELQKIPSYWLDTFVNSGWQMYVTDTDLDDTYYGGQYGAVMGSTHFDEHVIWLEDRDEVITEAVIHEFGHFVDCYYGFLSDTEEFINIYYAESDIFRNTFHVTCYYDQKEMFAEGFWKYLTDGATLQASCPQLYQFLASYV